MIITNLRICLKALSVEDETKIAYMYGKGAYIPTFIEKRNIIYGIIKSIVFLFFFVIRKMNFEKKKSIKSEILFYANTLNEYNTLIKVFDLTKKKYNASFLIDRLIFKGMQIPSGLEKEKFKFSDVICGTLLLVIRFPVLLKKLVSVDRLVSIKSFLYIYLYIYFYLPFFIRVITEIRPNFVCVANDHSVPNRCIFLVARFLDIKTIYMQHASVTSSFPPLHFDYAFLDGNMSLSSYEKSSSEGKSYFSRQPKIFLTGLKKNVGNKACEKNEFCVGIATNPLDRIELVECFIRELIKKNVKCLVRYHPRQAKEFIKKLSELEKNFSEVSVCNPTEITINRFFDRVCLLVADHSSVHLEAVLHGIKSYRYNFSGYDLYVDSYKYYENGIVEEFDEKILADSSVPIFDKKIFSKILKQYSETFGTSWQGKESLLVHFTIINIENIDVINKVYIKKDSSFFKEVYGLM